MGHTKATRSASPNVVDWYFVYILECADGTLYTGVAKSLLDRIGAHNRGTGAKYTRSRRPVKVVWSSLCDGRALAQRHEARIKRMTRAQKQTLIELGEDRS